LHEAVSYRPGAELRPANTFKPVGEGSLRLDGCDEDVLGDSVNRRRLRRRRSSNGRCADAVVPAFPVVAAGDSDRRQHEVVSKFQSGVVLGRQEVHVVTSALAVPEITSSGRHRPVNLCGSVADGRRGGPLPRRRDLDVVEEAVEDGRRRVADVAAEPALDARRYRLHREPIRVACHATSAVIKDLRLKD